MKIAVYTDSFLPCRGGTEIATYNLCKGLTEIGHQIILFCPDFKKDFKFDEFPVYQVKSLKLTETDKMVFRHSQYKKVLSKSKEFNPDIIYYCTVSGMARMAVDIAKELNVPCVATVHTKFKQALHDATHSKLIANLFVKSMLKKLNKTDRIVCVSHDLTEKLKEYGYKGKCEVIKNGIEGFDRDSKQTMEKDKNIFNFFFCGRIIKSKNIQFTLKSLSYLKNEKKFDNFKFYIAGSGNYLKHLKRLAKKLGIAENIIFIGYVGDKKILADYNSKAHLFLISSIFDNDPLVVLEASQCGTPTLALANTGSSERLVNNVNGFVANYDVKDFGERIYEIINNQELYNNVCNNLKSIFGESWNEVAKRYENVFTEELQKKSK